jgi:hypothetical protein
MSQGRSLRCADATPYLSALADGELAEPLHAAVAAHVETCPSCGAALARHRLVNDLFAALPDSVPSPAVLDRVLDRALAARAPQGGFEPVRRESMRRRGRGRTLGLQLGLRRLPALLTTPRLGPAPALVALRPRSFWRSTALPALAALLIISFALVAFTRLTPMWLGSHGVSTGTPSPAGDPYQRARQGVADAVASHPLRFTPEVPWNLPPSAVYQRADVDSASGTLDIFWSLAAPLAQLHVSEAPVALSRRGDYYPLLNGASTLAWQLPGKHAWAPGTFNRDTARLAVVQDDTTFSVGVDVAFPGGLDPTREVGTTQTQAANVLRLASLSMDSSRFDVPALAPPDVNSGVIHYVIQSGSGPGRVVRNAYVDLANQRAHVSVSDDSGRPLYEDYIAGGGDTRYDDLHGVYGHPTGASALKWDDVQLDAHVVNLFAFANNYLAYGDLWYIGQGQWDGHSVMEFAYTAAPYRTTVYVDLSRDAVLGAAVDYTAPQNAGVQGVTSPFSATVCQRYITVEFLASASASEFAAPQGYAAGTPPSPITCAG